MTNAVLELAQLAIAVATDSYAPVVTESSDTWALSHLRQCRTGSPAPTAASLFVMLRDDNADVALFVALVRTYERQAEQHGLADLQRQGLELARRACGLDQ